MIAPTVLPELHSGRGFGPVDLLLYSREQLGLVQGDAQVRLVLDIKVAEGLAEGVHLHVARERGVDEAEQAARIGRGLHGGLGVFQDEAAVDRQIVGQGLAHDVWYPPYGAQRRLIELL